MWSCVDLMGLPLFVESEDLTREYECRCTCDHNMCVDLRRRRQCWCRHWFIFQWVARSFVFPHVVIKRLSALMRIPRELFSRWGSWYQDQEDDKWHYTMLICFDPEGNGLSDVNIDRIANPDPTVVRLPVLEHTWVMQRFCCCGERLREGVPGWILSILGQGRGDYRTLFGNEGIRWQLESAMEQAGVLSFPRE